ncbi:MAG: MATE family efflux transporter [Hyphomicrobiales bacterium]|nr:MATE family efflux transporter [Hyphomicrobiales bacterium]
MNVSTSKTGNAGKPDFPALTYWRVFAISFPIILSNITTPLLGVTHTAVVGQLGEPHLIGAVALGATIFNLLFWAFGFLRMGTTGLTAQAHGAGRADTVIVILTQGLLLAGAAGLALVLLQYPLQLIALELLEASAAAEAETSTYFSIRIWSAPFALINYTLLGWFIGLAKTRIALILQLVLNGTNVVLSIIFVSAFGWGVAGVAIATIIAEMLAVIIGAILAWKELSRYGVLPSRRQIFDIGGMRRMLAVNSDLMIRTLCLLWALTFFTAEAARAGDVILAANALLYQFFNIAAYLLDGFAFATEALTGRAIGASQRANFRRTIHLTTVWAVSTATLVSAIYLLFGGIIIDMMTTSEDVRQTARAYLPWAAATPIVGVASFLLDGIFIGATRTRHMRNMMIVSLAVFFAAWALLTPQYGNHGLWASMTVFLLIRAVTLAIYFPALEKAAFTRATP